MKFEATLISTLSRIQTSDLVFSIQGFLIISSFQVVMADCRLTAGLLLGFCTK
jgi:hypothetical protein